ncbi:hypothetical protein A2363_02010 [Candidatus Gottesmanbacteria bacterium RIFOXYB1_FULL_47_11]|uniref:Uncharacterized protein n=1 Tax=Candidatus Gottesmanbacteria bacterium RIFOXYB1_FULL_47_11 TaxID=1798401 RepID=A0A1F6BDF8_9BACT|nr:MAG: hypothetical protein A2363_02010 [Candidatus Gottesmanbacteria bacterium RIFOXYB1_FULL_47_11]
MSNVLLHRKALILRKQKKSYSQIKAILGVSKSTLSEWLRAYPLTREEINNLRANSEIRIEKYRETMRKKRQDKLDLYRLEEKKKLLPLSKRELLIAGLFLYWGEGGKASRHTISINNTDPKLVQFSLYWMTRALHISKNNIRVYLHLYKDMNIQKEMRYWSKMLNIPLSQFSKPYIKDSKRSDIDQKGFGHGTCGVCAYNTVIKDNILIGIDVIAQHYVRKLF